MMRGSAGPLYPVGSSMITPTGAAGDGVTDDTTAIQTAINTLGTAGGGTLILDAKTYYIPSGLLMKANVRIWGQGWKLDSNAALSTGTIMKGNSTNPAFYYNNSDLGAQPSSGAISAAVLSGVNIRDLGCTNFNNTFAFGGLYNTSIWNAQIENIFVQQGLGWGFYFENSSDSVFRKLRVGAMQTGCTGGMFFAGSTSNYNQGNSRYDYLFAQTVVTSNARGIVFQARGGSKFNDLTVSHIQCNTGTPAKISQAATMANASANITITDNTKFPVDMPVTVSASANGFTKWQTYFVLTSAANVVTLGNRMRGTAITASGNTAVNLDTYGFPGLEIVGLSSGDAANNNIQPSTFYGVDMEGAGTNLVLLQRAAVDLQIGTIFDTQGTYCASALCVREGTFGSWRAIGALSYDCDSSFNGFFCNGATLATDSDAQAIVNTTPLGFYRDASLNLPVFNLNNLMGGQTHSLHGQNISGGSITYPQLPMGQHTLGTFTSATTSLNGSHAGSCAYTGTVNTVWTLPTLATGAGGSSGATSGLGYQITNASTTGGVTLTLNCGGTDNFNRNGAKTSYVMAVNTSMEIRANYDGGAVFWQVVSINGAV